MGQVFAGWSSVNMTAEAILAPTRSHQPSGHHHREASGGKRHGPDGSGTVGSPDEGGLEFFALGSDEKISVSEYLSSIGGGEEDTPHATRSAIYLSACNPRSIY